MAFNYIRIYSLYNVIQLHTLCAFLCMLTYIIFICCCSVCARNILYMVQFTACARSLTIFPRCCEDRVSRSVKTLPHTEISLHTPGLESSVKPLRGCITNTPFVVKPSICPSDVLHFAAFSWRATCSVNKKRNLPASSLYGHLIFWLNTNKS